MQRKRHDLLQSGVDESKGYKRLKNADLLLRDNDNDNGSRLR